MQAMRDAHDWVEERWPRAPYTILIEKSANGAEIIAALKRELTGVIAITVSTDKITRAIAASTTPREPETSTSPAAPRPTPQPATTRPTGSRT